METDKKSNGAFVGLIVIVIILVIGSIYIWHLKIKRLEEEKMRNAASIQIQ
jgi:hypothetical protein